MSKRKSSTLKKSDYLHWIGELKKRYRATQIKAAVAVNSAMIEFYWNLGKDISERYPGKRRGLDFFGKLSRDLQQAIPGSGSFSTRNLKYMLAFFEMYAYRQQLVADKRSQGYVQQLVADKESRTIVSDLVCVPRGHHVQILRERRDVRCSCSGLPPCQAWLWRRRQSLAGLSGLCRR